MLLIKHFMRGAYGQKIVQSPNASDHLCLIWQIERADNLPVVTERDHVNDPSLVPLNQTPGRR